jgi:hypothetical protein
MKAKFSGVCARRQACPKGAEIKAGDDMVHLGSQKNYHVGCEPGGPLDAHPLVQLATLERGPLPQAPTEGEGGFTAPTLQDWEVIAAAYKKSGVAAAIVNPDNDKSYGWGYQYFLVLDHRVRVSTTVDVRGGVRGKGVNAIDIVLLNKVQPGRLASSSKKVLRTPGWQGRVMERANKLLG